MKKTAILLILPLLFQCGCADQTKKDAALSQQTGNDSENLQGVWFYESITHSGKPYSFKPGDRVSFADNMIFWIINDDRVIAFFTINPNTNPKQFDIYDPDDKDKLIGYGIYKIEDDKLYTCDTTIENPRPKKFKSITGDDCYNVVLTRKDNRKN